MTKARAFVVDVAGTMGGMNIPIDDSTAPDDRVADAVVPAPATYVTRPGERFELTATSRVVEAGDDPAVRVVVDRFAAWLRRSTGYALAVTAEAPTAGDIVITLRPDAGLGAEDYTLRADAERVEVTAATAEGVFRGLTTLRLMLPAAAEATAVQPGPWTVQGADISDGPRFAYRGTMLDVARHFCPVESVLRYIDLIALYKVNRLHLHLTDDQGWRLPVPARPLLTEVGGTCDVEGGPGGSYTTEDYARIVAYAAGRFIEVVPEIDSPGHSTAALRAYPELSCDGVAPPLYDHTGISEVSMCAGKESTYDILGDVYDAAASVAGGLIHIGGDEAIGVAHDDFLTFVRRAATLVIERGRRVMAWHEAAAAGLPAGSVVQYWGVGQAEAVELARRAVADGAELVLSPGNHTYLDMKYDDTTPYGLVWAGTVPVSASYDWDPATLIAGVAESSILGVESALWSETVADNATLDYMVFPRLVGIAEIGWSPAGVRSWDGYRQRLAAQGPRWDVLGVSYFRSPEVPWPTA